MQLSCVIHHQIPHTNYRPSFSAGNMCFTLGVLPIQIQDVSMRLGILFSFWCISFPTTTLQRTDGAPARIYQLAIPGHNYPSSRLSAGCPSKPATDAYSPCIIRTIFKFYIPPYFPPLLDFARLQTSRRLRIPLPTPCLPESRRTQTKTLYPFFGIIILRPV